MKIKYTSFNARAKKSKQVGAIIYYFCSNSDRTIAFRSGGLLTMSIEKK